MKKSLHFQKEDEDPGLLGSEILVQKLRKPAKFGTSYGELLNGLAHEHK